MSYKKADLSIATPSVINFTKFDRYESIKEDFYFLQFFDVDKVVSTIFLSYNSCLSESLSYNMNKLLYPSQF